MSIIKTQQPVTSHVKTNHTRATQRQPVTSRARHHEQSKTPTSHEPRQDTYQSRAPARHQPVTSHIKTPTSHEPEQDINQSRVTSRHKAVTSIKTQTSHEHQDTKQLRASRHKAVTRHIKTQSRHAHQDTLTFRDLSYLKSIMDE
jgi:hypothetical protein